MFLKPLRTPYGQFFGWPWLLTAELLRFSLSVLFFASAPLAGDGLFGHVLARNGACNTQMELSDPFLKRERQTMKRIRSTLTRTILHNGWNGNETEFNAEEVHHDLTSDNGIQSYEVRHLVALSCGHYSNPFGLCSCCAGIVCKACMMTCASCAKPIGKCCGDEDKDDGRWYCTACSSARKRSGLLRRLLSPIIRFKDGNDGR